MLGSPSLAAFLFLSPSPLSYTAVVLQQCSHLFHPVRQGRAQSGQMLLKQPSGRLRLAMLTISIMILQVSYLLLLCSLNRRRCHLQNVQQ